jgi:hypothetical protein
MNELAKRNPVADVNSSSAHENQAPAYGDAGTPIAA